MTNLHSKIGASSCERFWNCPGSITVYGDLPPSKDTFYSAQGTVAHGVGERYLKSGKPVDDAMLGTIIEQDGFNIEVTDDMLEAVSVYVNVVQERVLLLDLTPNRLGVEVSFSLSHLDPEAYGTGDAIIYAPFDRIVALDYKHGAGYAVEAENNKQTLYYGLAAYYQVPEVEREFLEYIETGIIQPRCAHPEGPVRIATYSIDQLLEFESGLRDAIGRVRRGDTTLKAGRHCKFCPAQSICSEARADIARMAKVEFAHVNAEIPIKPHELNGGELANLLGHIPRIRDWCDSLEKHAYAALERGVEIPNYQLVPRRSNRKWKDEKTVIEEFDLEYGKKMYEQKLKTPAQLEKLFPKKERHRLESFWEKPDAGHTLARCNGDTREKRLPAAITDFVGLDL